MATRTVTLATENDGVQVATWADLDGTDDGTPVRMPRWNDKTVQVTGGSGTITIQGSNDGTNWSTLNDVNGVDLSGLAVGAIAAIAEDPLFIRPLAATGVNLKVVIVGATNR